MVQPETAFGRGTTYGAGAFETIPPEDSLGSALWLTERGLWPIVVSPAGDARWPNPGKSPIGKGWGKRRPSALALRRLFERHPHAGLAVLLGPAGGVVDLEVDEPEAGGVELGRLFPRGVPSTMGWRSARGEHHLFAWDHRIVDLACTAVVSFGGGALELRLGAADKRIASVCPPSLTAAGAPRVWNGCWRIAPFPAELITALRSLSNRVVERKPRAHGQAHSAMTRLKATGQRYAAAALSGEVESVRSAEPGGRNRTLNRAAFSLGQLVAGGLLDRADVEEALLDAARGCGLGSREALATIRSGIEAGIERPRRHGG